MHERSFTACLRGSSAQISRFGATAGSHLDGQAANHIGGYLRAGRRAATTFRHRRQAEEYGARST